MNHHFLLVTVKETPWSLALGRALSILGHLDVVSQEEVLGAVTPDHIDLVVIDATVVDDPAGLTASLRAHRPETRVVVATASPTWRRAREAFAAGASDYVRKSLDDQELRKGIEAVLALPPPSWSSPSLSVPGKMPSESGRTLLFADNDPLFLKTRAEFLQRAGYRVMLAADPNSARQLLEAGGIDLAILDVRLREDDDDKDISGLTIAKEVARAVPKIILTGFPSADAVRKGFRLQLDGLPSAVDFVSKVEGPDVLLAAVRRSLERRAAPIG